MLGIVVDPSVVGAAQNGLVVVVVGQRGLLCGVQSALVVGGRWIFS